MSDLKTLKEFKTYMTEGDHNDEVTCVSSYDLRAEAIKWIKTINDKNNWKEDSFGDVFVLPNSAWLVDIPYEQNDAPAVKTVLMAFFDLKEEDLE